MTPSSIIAISRDAIPELRALYARAAAMVPTAESMAVMEAAVARRGSQPVRGGVALLRLHGMIMQRPGLIEEFLGAVSLDNFMAAFRTAIADPEVATVVLDIDSPGGETSGLTEAAAELRAGREQKRVVAVANGMTASAAYWLASQATEVVATPTAIVGNIGVFVVHDDISGALEQQGIKRDIIASSDLKASFAPGNPLSEEARAQLEAIVAEQESLFVNDVAKGRGVTATVVRSDYGGGGILGANGAKAAGLVDRVASLSDVIARSLPRSARAAATGGVDVAAEIDVPGPGESLETITIPDGETPAVEPEIQPEPKPEPEVIEEPKAVGNPDELELRKYRARQHARLTR